MPSVAAFSSKDFDRFLKYLRQNPDVMLKHAQVAMKTSTLLLEGSSKKNAPSNEGTLRKGIISTITPLKSSVIATAKHSIFVHDGTKPHWPPFQPNGALDRWAKAKGIPTFLVARAIARKGTKAQPFMDEAIEENESKINQLFKTALDDAANELANV